MTAASFHPEERLSSTISGDAKSLKVAALFYILLEGAKVAGVEPDAYLRRAAHAAMRGVAIPLARERTEPFGRRRRASCDDGSHVFADEPIEQCTALLRQRVLVERQSST